MLDVGCAEGLLRAWLPQTVKYHGIECSSEACQRARERLPADAIVNVMAERFEAGDAKYDCVIFNEMLYYARDPVGLVDKYSRLLTASGVMICSIFQKPPETSLRRRILRKRNPSPRMWNIDCEAVIRNYMHRNHWQIIRDWIIPIPESTLTWHIWSARPPVQR